MKLREIDQNVAELHASAESGFVPDLHIAAEGSVA